MNFWMVGNWRSLKWFKRFYRKATPRFLSGFSAPFLITSKCDTSFILNYSIFLLNLTIGYISHFWNPYFISLFKKFLQFPESDLTFSGFSLTYRHIFYIYNVSRLLQSIPNNYSGLEYSFWYHVLQISIKGHWGCLFSNFQQRNPKNRVPFNLIGNACWNSLHDL